MTMTNSFVYVDPNVNIKECLPENMYLEVLLPSLLACALICSTHPSCRGVSFVTGSRGCIACNGSYVSVEESNANLTGAMVYQKGADDPSAENWTSYEDSSYLVFGNENVTWKYANKTCFDHDPPSTLIVIDSPAEQDFLIAMLQKFGGNGNYWTDAITFENGDDSKWLWSSNRNKILVWERGHYVWSPSGKEKARVTLLRLAMGVDQADTYCGGILKEIDYKMGVATCMDNSLMGFVCEQNRTVLQN